MSSGSITSVSRVLLTFGVFALCSTFGVYMVRPPQAMAAPITIMFLGDSITEGGIGQETSFGYVGFRSVVENQLRSHGVAYDFVGIVKNGANPLNPLPDGSPGPMFDQDNNGHPGRGESWFFANLSTVIPTGMNADYVIFLLGTNDMYFDVASLLPKYELLWDGIFQRLPGVRIIVSATPPNLNVPTFQNEFNGQLAAHVATRVANGQKISYVDPGVLISEMADNLHPNSAGHERMGQKYAQTLLSFIQGNATPTPSPTTKLGDGNADNKVDGIDYVIWLNNFGITTSSGPTKGDYNKDTKVDGIDYVMWLNNFGL